MYLIRHMCKYNMVVGCLYYLNFYQIIYLNYFEIYSYYLCLHLIPIEFLNSQILNGKIMYNI